MNVIGDIIVKGRGTGRETESPNTHGITEITIIEIEIVIVIEIGSGIVTKIETERGIDKESIEEVGAIASLKKVAKLANGLRIGLKNERSNDQTLCL